MNFPSRLTAQLTAPITDADSPKPSKCLITSTLWGIEQLNPFQFIARAPATAAANCSGWTSQFTYR